MRAAETCCSAAAILGSRYACSATPGSELFCACAGPYTAIPSVVATKIADCKSRDFMTGLSFCEASPKTPHYLWSEKSGVACPQPLTNRCGELNIIRRL